MIYKSNVNMKNLLTLLLLFFSVQLFSQQWIEDSNFDDKIYKND